MYIPIIFKYLTVYMYIKYWKDTGVITSKKTVAYRLKILIFKQKNLTIYAITLNCIQIRHSEESMQHAPDELITIEPRNCRPGPICAITSDFSLCRLPYGSHMHSLNILVSSSQYCGRKWFSDA